MENNEQYDFDPMEAKIKKLQSALYLIAAVHCSDGHEEEETCVYCSTKWPCFTARVARRSAADF